MSSIIDSPSNYSAWEALASDYSTDIIKRPPIGQTKNIGSIESIAELFKNRYNKIPAKQYATVQFIHCRTICVVQYYF